MTEPCTGAWCRKREKCEHYLAHNPLGIDVRLCVRGVDGVLAPLVRPIKFDEAPLENRLKTGTTFESET